MINGPIRTIIVSLSKVRERLLFDLSDLSRLLSSRRFHEDKLRMYVLVVSNATQLMNFHKCCTQ